MLKSQIKTLDRLFQRLKEPKSIFGGWSECSHHFITKAQGRATRWYLPNGIPLTIKQHNEIHGKNSKEMEDYIIGVRGEEWYKDLMEQKRKDAHGLKYETVKLYLEGKRDNYL